jgi:hypothetical protein
MFLLTCVDFLYHVDNLQILILVLFDYVKEYSCLHTRDLMLHPILDLVSHFISWRFSLHVQNNKHSQQVKNSIESSLNFAENSGVFKLSGLNLDNAKHKIALYLSFL